MSGPPEEPLAAEEEEAAPSLYTRLLALSREAHGCGQHEAAYHALAAALHAAVDAADRAALGEVLREASTQIAWIDRHAPEHRLSTHSAEKHQHPGVYVMLSRQAAAHEQMAAAHGQLAAPHVPRGTRGAPPLPPPLARD